MTLLLHTGGTIGMRPGPHGLTPASGVVEAAVGARAQVIAFDPLIDSAEISARHWNRLLDLIEAEAGPVVITHGTDTMAYTGAALSQALAGWPHPVVLTGSMHPLGTMGGDAEGNLDLALGARPGAGVWLAFAGRLLPAAGLVKTESQADDAFRATPQPAEAGPWRRRRFAAARLAVLTVSPGMPAAMLEAALGTLDGAVLRVFGAGTIPSDPELAEVLARAVATGRRLRAVSACENGGLAPGAYAAGAPLWRAGVANGGTETAEAALIRLWLALS
ncbi:asparaginase domain-containing protein [Paenirhodobacter enshiensis]|uniref:asparaginase domain-containing protein n=1 Tax=Paenirhodobacter enshiensis TaxID=1105367 RepID=UPI003FA2E58B